MKKYYKILLMDDEEHIRIAFKEILELLNYKVVTCENGDEAIKIYKETVDTKDKFDIVILDLTVRGGKGGKETIKELKKIDPNVKTILISGYSVDNEVMDNYDKFGFDTKLEKPFLLSEIKNKLENIIQKIKKECEA